MKHLFKYFVIAAIALTAGFFAAPLFAQGIDPLEEGQFYTGTTGTTAENTSEFALPPKTAAADTLATVEDCSGLTAAFTKPIKCGVVPAFANFMLTFTSQFLYLAGIFFNFSMAYTLNLAAQVDRLHITEAWSIIRDLVNIGFIFTLLWIAIQTILEMGDWKRPLISIIIAALLINFSLFFTKVIIDVSNTFALQFYSSITDGKFISPDSPLDGGISDQFAERLKIASIYKANGNSLSFSEITSVAIFGSIFLLVTAGVFFVAGLLFLARSAILIMLMVLSPIGFIGGWLPRFGDQANKWWRALFSECLSAPVFLLIIWVVLKITDKVDLLNGATDAITSQGSATFANVFAGTSGAVGIVFNFLLLIAFTIFALNQAKSLSSSASNSFTGWAQKKLGSGAGSVLSGTSFLGRNVVGKYAARLADNQTVRGWAAKENTLGRLSMLGLRGAEGVAKSNFDVRSTSLGSGIGAALKAGGVTMDAGKATGAGGFRKEEDTFIKKEAKAMQDQAKLLEFKETEKEKEDRKAREGDNFKSARKITEERQQSFANRIKPTYATTGLKAAPVFAPTSLTGATFKAKLEAARNIEKGIKGSKLEEDKDRLEGKLKDLLKELNKDGETEVNEKNIDTAIDAANEKLSRAEAEVSKLREGATVDEIARKRSAVKSAEKKLKDLEKLQEKIDKLQEKIDKGKKDGEDKKDDKKDEEKKDDKK